jgi:Sec-independent protein translocase protein TatA
LIRIAGPAGWWYVTAQPIFVSFLLVALLLFLLFGGSRVSAAGKGLGEAVRHVKRAVAEDAEPAPDPSPAPPSTMISPALQEPKLLPAKGESSASSEGEDR